MRAKQSLAGASQILKILQIIRASQHEEVLDDTKTSESHRDELRAIADRTSHEVLVRHVYFESDTPAIRKDLNATVKKLRDLQAQRRTRQATMGEAKESLANLLKMRDTL